MEIQFMNSTLKCNFYFSILILSFISGYDLASGQERLVNISENNDLKSVCYNTNIYRLKATEVPDTLPIPFIDDFSDITIYPDTGLWADNNAYINSSFCIKPLTLGVATLDAIDSTGKLYENASFKSFIADRLTSLPLDIELPINSNVFLSFLYQPGGYGDVPEEKDSLVLQFYDKNENVWNSVWRASYSEKDTTVYEISANDTLKWKPDTFPKVLFKNVIIPINEQTYLVKGFQFRLLNYASLVDDPDLGEISNSDFWHIDYVKINKNRFPGDTILNDVAFYNSLPPLLKNYTSMPWDHFVTSVNAFNEWRGRTNLYVRNNYDEQIGFERSKSFTDLKNKITVSRYTGGDSLNALSNIALPDVLPGSFSDLFQKGPEDSARYELKAYLTTDEEDHKENDTVSRIQEFYNYYSYDDGTAELGYGISGQGSINAQIAIKYSTYKIDTIRAVYIYFNRALNDANDVNFFLTVWNDNDGQPGDTVYNRSLIDYHPKFSAKINKFQRYDLDSIIVVEDVFYVGITQAANTFLNIGFDKNTVRNDRTFININGTWNNSKFAGALMIRPVFGHELPPVTHVQQINQKQIRIFPNPASHFINIEMPLNEPEHELHFLIYNVHGKLLKKGHLNTRSINISELETGMYILRIIDYNKKGIIFYNKFFVFN